MTVQSEAAFFEQLDALLATHPRRWVAYHGRERLGIGDSCEQLLQKFKHEHAPSEMRCFLIDPSIRSVARS